MVRRNQCGIKNVSSSTLLHLTKKTLELPDSEILALFFLAYSFMNRFDTNFCECPLSEDANFSLKKYAPSSEVNKSRIR